LKDPFKSEGVFQVQISFLNLSPRHNVWILHTVKNKELYPEYYNNSTANVEVP